MSCQASVQYKITLSTRSKNKVRIISNLEAIINGYKEKINDKNDDFCVNYFQYVDDLIVVYVNSNGTMSPRQIVHKIKQRVLILLKKDFVHLAEVYSFWLRDDIIESLNS